MDKNAPKPYPDLAPGDTLHTFGADRVELVYIDKDGTRATLATSTRMGPSWMTSTAALSAVDPKIAKGVSALCMKSAAVLPVDPNFPEALAAISAYKAVERDLAKLAAQETSVPKPAPHVFLQGQAKVSAIMDPEVRQVYASLVKEE